MKPPKYEDVEQALLHADITSIEGAGQTAYLRREILKKRIKNLEPEMLRDCIKTWLAES